MRHCLPGFQPIIETGLERVCLPRVPHNPAEGIVIRAGTIAVQPAQAAALVAIVDAVMAQILLALDQRSNDLPRTTANHVHRIATSF